uniref:Protein prenyltransferase alpha subunit repeat-containing protein 1 n=1 Tax=Aegilops tauschii TaxID=37682 RepID=M8BPD6_AEGTA
MESKEAAAAAQAEEDLLRDFERILHDDPLIFLPLDRIPWCPIHGVVSWHRRDEVGFLHPTQFHSLLVDSTDKSTSQYFWCVDHKLAVSSSILPDLYRAARRAHSNATLNPSSSPSASDAALIMTHSKALLILCADLLTAWNSRKMVLSTNFNLSHLKDELRLCALILSYSPKNESTWSHRRWVIKNLAQHLQDMPELIDKESLLVKDMAEKSKMNYRAWRHRCWLIPYMKTKQSLLLALLDGAANREDSLICQSEAYLMWKEELRWNETLIRRYQGRESLWNHRRFLSQWWVQHLLSCEETSLSNESLADLFLSQEIHLLSDCLGAPGDEFGETRVQVELAALYILWISEATSSFTNPTRRGSEREGGREVEVGGKPEGGVGKGLPGEEQTVDSFASLLSADLQMLLCCAFLSFFTVAVSFGSVRSLSFAALETRAYTLQIN